MDGREIRFKRLMGNGRAVVSFTDFHAQAVPWETGEDLANSRPDL